MCLPVALRMVTGRSAHARSKMSQLRYIRKNLYTAVVVADGASLTGLAALAKAVFFVNANAPVRTGFVLYAEKPQGDHAPRGMVTL